MQHFRTIRFSGIRSPARIDEVAHGSWKPRSPIILFFLSVYGGRKKKKMFSCDFRLVPVPRQFLRETVWQETAGDQLARKVKGLVYGTPAGQNSSTWYPFLDGTSTGRIGRGRLRGRGARGAILAEPFMGKANDQREIGTRIARLCSFFHLPLPVL